MKKLNNSSWIVILGSALLISAIMAFLPKPQGKTATVLINGQVFTELSLETDTVLPIHSAYGHNTLTVKNGMIAVTDSDCPGHDCMKMGYRSEGAPIVCLPHNLVITFDGESQVDGMAG